MDANSLVPQGFGAALQQPQATDEGPTPNVSPEEQAQYDQFVANAQLLMFDKQTRPGVLKMLEAKVGVPFNSKGYFSYGERQI